MLVLIKGAGDLATGTAVRLYRAGIPVVMTEVARPTAVRRTVAFSQCMYDGAAQVEGIAARRAEDAGAARRAGAFVYERFDQVHKGKGYAMDYQIGRASCRERV